MKLVITGSKGMIGEKVSRYFSRSGYDVYNTNFDLTVESNYRLLNKDEDFIVIHIAGRKTGEAQDFLRDNIGATSCLIKDVIKSDKFKGIVFISTIAVYGINESTITEEDGFLPSNYYGKSKLICENIIKAFIPANKYFILRPTNVFAEGKDSILGKLIEIIENKNVFEAWSGSLEAKRDYILIDDIIAALEQIVKAITQNESVAYNEYNLASGQSYSMKEIIKIVENITGKKLEINIIENNSFVSKDLIVNNDRLCKLLNRNALDIRAIALED